MVSLANPEFPRFFFIHEHFERFLTKEHDRYQPAWYFLPVLLHRDAAVDRGPVPGAAARAGDARSAERASTRGASCSLWCAVVFVFFSASSSKLARPTSCRSSRRSSLLDRGLSALGGPRRMLLAQVGRRLRARGARSPPQRRSRLTTRRRRSPPCAARGLRAVDRCAAGLALAAGGARRGGFPVDARHARSPAVLSLACGGLALAQAGALGARELGAVPFRVSYRPARSGTS